MSKRSPRKPAKPKVSLRPVEPADRDFLRAVYGSTRADELRLTDWPEEQKAEFVRMQFEAQDAYYREHYPGAQWEVILVGKEPAGRLYVHRRTNEIRLMEITLLPAFRGRGVGSRLLDDLLAEATREGKPLSVHVEIYNLAYRLYQRLGFEKVEDRGVYHLLRWTPAQREDPSS
jgi:ribosomal protein S18 acetylase RimI-like enzyme